jgi:trans-aconitate methyltransferase
MSTAGTGTWDADRYDGSFGYVSALGRGVVTLLDPRPGDRVLDLGCGTGRLTATVAAAGARVWGIDADAAMIAKARLDHPHVRFELADGHTFEVEEPVDAVMSNAALHWMLRADDVIARVHTALRPAGRFVAEFGGQGNIATIHRAVLDAAESLGVDRDQLPNPWYFPSPAEHAARLESGGFRVRSLELVDRPTPLSSDGITGWLRMFGDRLLAPVPSEQREELIRSASDRCRATLERDGRWFADYVRLRFVAEKV